MTAWVEEGRLKVEETVVDGLDKAPQAFESLFRHNANVGKVVIQVAEG